VKARIALMAGAPEVPYYRRNPSPRLAMMLPHQTGLEGGPARGLCRRSALKETRPVDLYLIRHADALALGERGITDDADRPLSEKGEAQSQAAAQALHKCGVTLDRLFTSPLLRARQTADLFLKTLPHSNLAVESCEALAPGSKPRKLSRFLLKQEAAHVGLVGHMPHLAEVAAWLIGSKKAQIDIAKSGIACLTCGEAPGKGMAVLRWLVTPDWYS
jgi:phosphohistidine phosphatase